MVAAPVRPHPLSGVALAAAGALALTPLGLTPVLPAPISAPPAPAWVHVEDVALAGIGQEIYYAVTPWVQYAVGGGSYLINFIPLVGGLAAAQINIDYFQGIQPVVEATVNYLAGVVQNPLSFFPTTAAYLGALYDIGYNWVSAQLRFIGLDGLAPLPQGAASTRRGAVTRVPAPAASGEDVSDSPAASGQDVPVRPPSSDSATTTGRQPLSGARQSLSVDRESLRGGHTRARTPRADHRTAEAMTFAPAAAKTVASASQPARTPVRR